MKRLDLTKLNSLPRHSGREPELMVLWHNELENLCCQMVEGTDHQFDWESALIDLTIGAWRLRRRIRKVLS